MYCWNLCSSYGWAFAAAAAAAATWTCCCWSRPSSSDVLLSPCCLSFGFYGDSLFHCARWRCSGRFAHHRACEAASICKVGPVMDSSSRCEMISWYGVVMMNGSSGPWLPAWAGMVWWWWLDSSMSIMISWAGQRSRLPMFWFWQQDCPKTNQKSKKSLKIENWPKQIDRVIFYSKYVRCELMKIVEGPVLPRGHTDDRNVLRKDAGDWIVWPKV